MICNDVYEKVDDYSYPVDALNEYAEENNYEDPIYPIHKVLVDEKNEAPGTEVRHSRSNLRDTNIRFNADTEYLHEKQITVVEARNVSRRKFSLGDILRKISAASIQGKKRKTSLQEGSLGSALSKMITLPICMKRTFDDSYQVDSSSWEFLNRNVEDDCARENLNKEVTKDKNGKSENIYPRRKQYTST